MHARLQEEMSAHEATKSQLAESQVRIQQLDEKASGLKKQIEKLEQNVFTIEEEKTLLNQHCSDLQTASQAKENEWNKQHGALRAELEASSAAVTRLKDEVNCTQTSLSSAKELLTKAQADLSASKDTIQQQVNKIQELQSQYEETQDKRQQLIASMKQQEQHLSASQARSSALEEELRERTEELTSVHCFLEEIKATNKDLEKQLKAVSSAKEQLLQATSKENAEFLSSIDLLASEKKELQIKVASEQERASQLSAESDKLAAELSNKNQALQSASMRLTEAQQAISRAEQARDQQTEQRKQLEAQVSELSQKRIDLEKRVAKLEQENRSYRVNTEHFQKEIADLSSAHQRQLDAEAVQHQNDTLQSQLASAFASVQKLQSELQQVTKIKAQLEIDVENTRSEFLEMQAKFVELSNQHTTLQEAQRSVAKDHDKLALKLEGTEDKYSQLDCQEGSQ